MVQKTTSNFIKSILDIVVKKTISIFRKKTLSLYQN